MSSYTASQATNTAGADRRETSPTQQLREQTHVKEIVPKLCPAMVPPAGTNPSKPKLFLPPEISLEKEVLKSAIRYTVPISQVKSAFPC